jgi:hypothetical protein
MPYASIIRAQARAKQVQESGHGMPVVLHDGSVFWSKGWRGCERCWARADDWHVPMLPFVERDDGVVRSGWRCA